MVQKYGKLRTERQEKRKNKTKNRRKMKTNSKLTNLRYKVIILQINYQIHELKAQIGRLDAKSRPYIGVSYSFSPGATSASQLPFKGRM